MRSTTINRYLKGRGFQGKVQRQKLLYYAQAWHLAWYGRPLFDDGLEAWPMGPVAPEAFRNEETSPALDRREEPNWVTVHLDAVCGYYGSFHGNALMRRSHSEAPWRDAWGSPDPRISRASLLRYFSAPGVTGPQRPAVPPRLADESAVEQALTQLAPSLAGVDRLLAVR